MHVLGFQDSKTMFQGPDTLFQDAGTLCDESGEGRKARRAASLGICAQVSCYAMLCCACAMLCELGGEQIAHKLF